MHKTVLITGAASGFGRDTAETFAKAGHVVYASMRDPAGRNAEAAAALRAQGIKVVELDVTDDASVDRAVSQVLAEAGRIDVLVNNAGMASAGVSEAFTANQTKLLFDTNVIGVFRVTRAVLPSMRAAREGLIVNIGSILGRVTFPFFGIYGASKFALEALSDSFRYELSQSGVDVVLVQPSAYPTNMYAAIQAPADASVMENYGSVGEVPGKMFESFMAMFEGPEAPDPHDVAQAIEALVAAPRQDRPARKVVGHAFGADQVNESVAPLQQATIEALDLGFLSQAA